MPRHVRRGFPLAPLLLASVAIAAPGIEIGRATLSGGSLVIEGKAAAGATVRIDGTSFEKKANANGKFSFDVAYRPPNCAVTLAAGAASVDVLIDRCAPGVVTRGVWSANKSFAEGDLALHEGSTWLALRANKGKQPGEAGSQQDWQIFAAEGPEGARGPAGPEGKSSIFATGKVRERFCDGSSEFPYTSGGEVFDCAIFCPVGTAAITGWAQNASRAFAGVLNPRLVSVASSFRFEVREWGSSFGDELKVAILCLDEPSPITEPPAGD